MKKNTIITLAAIVSSLLSGRLAPVQAQEYSTASAINDSGSIAGGTCLPGCEEFNGFVKDHGGVHLIGTLGGPASILYGINQRGEAVGQSDTADLDELGENISLAILVGQWGVRNLGTLSGYASSQAFAINASGLIAGRVYNSDPEDPVAPMHAVVFRPDGTISDLGTLGGRTSVAFALNDVGQVVGRARTSAGAQHAFLYERGVMRDLGTLGGNLSTARAINNRGQITGGARRALPGPSHAFLYQNGTMRDLGTLGGAYSEGFAINDAGLIVGASDTAAGELHAFVLLGGSMRDLGTLGGSYSGAFGLNHHGDIVGESETPSGAVHAFIWRDGVMSDLGPLP